MARRGGQRGGSPEWPSPDQGVASLAVGQPGAAEPTGDNGRALRTLALVAVVVGLVALTTAACVFSYSSVHAFALRAGVSPSFARIYPYAGDAMLALAGCSVLALRGAGLISRAYGWLCFIVLLGTLAASSVTHVAGISMPERAAEITVAVFPWALVLGAFGLLLALLRHARRRRLSQRASSPVNGDAEAGLEYAAFEPDDQAGAYGSGTGEADQYDPITHEATAVQGPMPPDSALPDPTRSDQNADRVSVPHPRQGDQSDDPPPAAGVSGSPAEDALPQRAVIRPTEMQLRARAQRAPEPIVSHEPDTVPNPTLPPAAPSDPASVPAPGAGGYPGDTNPRGELSPAPTVDPPELDRPHSSPTPPSE